MLFDEVVFERQRVDFRFGYYIIEIGDIGNHRRDLFRFLRGIEILLDSVKFAGECIELLVFKCFSVCFERLDVKTSSRIDEPFNISHLEFMISFSSSTSFLLLLPFSNSFFKWVYMSVSNYFIPIF